VIFKGSRYEQLARAPITVTDASGARHGVLRTRFIPPTPASFRHRMSANERLDLVAFHFYGDATRFWLIADANPVMDPEELLEPGLEILIPPDRRL
jgi:nucleoid-associated protein YgaU